MPSQNFQPPENHGQFTQFHHRVIQRGIAMQNDPFKTKAPPGQPGALRVNGVDTLFMEMAQEDYLQLGRDGFADRPADQAKDDEDSHKKGDPPALQESEEARLGRPVRRRTTLWLVFRNGNSVLHAKRSFTFLDR